MSMIYFKKYNISVELFKYFLLARFVRFWYNVSNWFI